jgi:hypothetical protein
MRCKASPRIEVVRREDKESRLTNFILEFVKASAGATEGQNALLVARSLKSPVVRAVKHLATTGRLRLRIHAILSSLEVEPGRAARPGELDFAESVRLARNPRLLDAHELLVLGPVTSWFGDSMRREPEKRDAWERFAAECAETARHAQLSFERLWQASEPIALPKDTAPELIGGALRDGSAPAGIAGAGSAGGSAGKTLLERLRRAGEPL